MKNVTFSNGQLTKDLNLIITNGYEVKSGKVGGCSIEVPEMGLMSYIYYGECNDRDADLSKLKTLIADAND